MLEQFRSNMQAILAGVQELPENPKILLALSGGVDSSVMADLFHRSGYSCAVAHCNFMLRGHESDADQDFVKELTNHYGFDFHVKRFQTAAYAEDNHLSIQLAARHLRYTWFKELARSYQYAFIAVAHHADDVAETMLLNLVRGAGLAGMHGISAVNGNIIRPLLFASRKDIEMYASRHQLNWREDASNSEEVYRRNKIRLSVIPQLKEINPSVVDALVKHAHLMSRYERLLHNFISLAETGLVQHAYGGAIQTISTEKLLLYAEPEVLLYHFLNRYGFNGQVCSEVLESERPGATFFAPGYKLVKGRGMLTLIHTDELISEEEYLIHENESTAELRFGMLDMMRISGKSFAGPAEQDDFGSRNTAYVDGDKLVYPLKVRRWNQGDYFHPLGMHGRKLLSDYFIDEKFTVAQKELVYLLLSGNDIVWVIGHRMDDRFKITDSTTATRKFTWKQLN